MQNNQLGSKISLKSSSVDRIMEVTQSELPQIQKYDTNKLFEQFKRHLLRQDKRQFKKNTTTNNELKDLLSGLKKSNQQKRKRIQKIRTHHKSSANLSRVSSNNLFSDVKNECKPIQNHTVVDQPHVDNTNSDFSGCKFKPLRPQTSENKFRINTGKSRVGNNQFLQSRLMQSKNNFHSTKIQMISHDQVALTAQSQVHPHKTILQISEQILMVQVQESRLHEQINTLKKSLNQLTKQLRIVNKQVEIQQRNQQKYKHISYLATGIQNQTDYIKSQNSKGYHSMVVRHEDTLSQMKKFKMNLRRQKDQLQTGYIEDINQWVKMQDQKNVAKKRQFLFSSSNTLTNVKSKSCQKNNFSLRRDSKQNVLSLKMTKRQIDQLEAVIQLLRENQPNYQQIKQQQCSKVRLGKINKLLLSKQRVEMLERIQEFQLKFSMKMASIENLILKIHQVIFNQNQSLQSQCVKLTKIKQELQGDLRQLQTKNQIYMQNSQEHEKLMIQEQLNRRKMNQLLKNNSRIFVKVINAFYTMLFKFRHMFSLALTLDIDKKSFRECVIQIDSTFNSGIFFTFNFDKHLISSSQRHDIINQKQFKQILVQKCISEQLAQELTQIMFNDHRINLILHKSWIQNSFRYLAAQGTTESDVIDIIEAARIDCEQIYKTKLPSLVTLFLTCLESISMSKYQMKLAASSNERDSIFLRTGPTKKFHCLQMIDQSIDFQDKDTQAQNYQPQKKRIQFDQSKKQQSIFEKNPRRIIYNLEKIKNKSQNKFKPLNFAFEGKTYKYNQQIIIPDFPLIQKNEHF